MKYRLSPFRLFPSLKGLSMSRSAGLYSGSNNLGPFSHFIDVNGIKIVSLGNIGGQQSVDKKFTLKAARVVQELLSSKHSEIDSVNKTN